MSARAVIVAAGKGTRAGLGVNKVYWKLNGRTVLMRSLDAFAQSGLVDGIVLVISEDDRALWEKTLAEEGPCPLITKVVYGGDTRRESVYNGLCALPEDTQLVAVHDAARPFVTKAIIAETLASARDYGSGVISMPVVDTIKRISPDGRVTTPPRAELRAVQTPQSFRYPALMAAHRRAAAESFAATDDAMLYEHYYNEIRLVSAQGTAENIKLTHKSDFDRFAPAFLVGQGYDAHRLKEGRRLILCGVDVPHTKGLDGHSDADVAVHALMDAILGALGEGDIGRHFPDSDDAYRGISSMRLLDTVMTIVREHGMRVGNADVTIVAQKPKLAAYIPRMRENLCRALNTGNVNVKATTTERMGFEGEEIGISAQAVVLLSR